MWKVRFFGLSNDSFDFLNELTEDTFSIKNVEHKGSSFTEYYLHLENHDEEDATKILEKAEIELQVYSSLLKLNNLKCEIKVDFPCKVHDDGTETVFMSFFDTICITDEAFAVTNDEIIIDAQKQKIDSYKVILQNAFAKEINKELIILLGKEINWINAYKIYEILKTHFIAENELKKDSTLKYFAHSANSPKAIGVGEARHAIQRTENPKQIADLKQAHKKMVDLSLKFIKDNA